MIRKGPILCILFESLSVRKEGGEKLLGQKGGREGRWREGVVYSGDSQDAERDASNEKSHLRRLPFSHTASLLLPARFELRKNRWR